MNFYMKHLMTLIKTAEGQCVWLQGAEALTLAQTGGPVMGLVPPGAWRDAHGHLGWSRMAPAAEKQGSVHRPCGI